MKCLVCGRKLRNTQSKELGYGPVCYKRKFGIAPHTAHRDENSSTGKKLDSDLLGQISIYDYL